MAESHNKCTSNDKPLRGIQNNDDDHDDGSDVDLGMGEVACSSFIYLDHNGEMVPPEEETSWLMAQGIIPASDDDEQNVDTPKQSCPASSSHHHHPASTTTSTNIGEETPFSQDPEEFERERNSASERLERALQLEAAAGGCVPSYYNVDANLQLGDASEADEGGGMDDARTFSRALTVDEDEWILEAILRRRAIRQSASITADRDYATFYDEFGTKSSGMRGAGWVEYLCKWKWYEEPTWEKRDLLVDEGYMQECNRFDDKVLGGSTALSGKGVVATPTSYIAKQIASGLAPSLTKAKSKKTKKTYNNHDDSSEEGSSSTTSSAADGITGPGIDTGAYDRVLKYLYANQQPPKPPKKPSENETSFGNSRPVEALAGITEYDIKWWFRQDNMKALRYGTVATQKKIDHFIRTYQSLQRTHKPMVFFHGTQPDNLPSIAEKGLRVPEGRHQVVNGAVHGLGIYAAFKPRLASSYCRGHRNNFGGKATQRLLICVVLVSPNDPNVSVINNWCVVVRDSAYIIPVLAVDICQGYTHKPTLTRRNYCLENLPPIQRASTSCREMVPRNLRVGLTKATNQNVEAYKRVAEKMRVAEEKASDNCN